MGVLGNDSVQLSSIITERIEGVREVRYRPGRVVTTTGTGFAARSMMALPSVLDLAD